VEGKIQLNELQGEVVKLEQNIQRAKQDILQNDEEVKGLNEKIRAMETQ